MTSPMTAGPDDRSLATWLRAASSLLTPDLVDADGLAAMCAVAQHLPGGLTSSLVIETRLGDTTRVADFALRIDDTDGRHHLLAGMAPSDVVAPYPLDQPVWRRIAAFARKWADGAPELRDLAMWLEFDTAGPPAAARVPSVFFQPGPKSSTAISDRDGRPIVRAAWTRPQLDRVLAHWPVPTVTDTPLARCFTALSGLAGIESVGLLCPRVPADMRLTIAPFTKTELVSYLRAIDWPGDGPDFQDFIALLPDFARALRLNVDVGATLGPRISIECYWLCPPGEFRADSRWLGFLDDLVARGLARRDKCEAVVRNTPYIESDRTGESLWPADLAAMSKVLGDTRRSVFWRYPGYLKLGYQAGRPVESKAYFSLTHLWVPRPV